MSQAMVGIVLGAGSSRRLGRPKQTLPLGDTTLLGWVLRDVEVSALDRIVLVVGGAADEALAG
jgi:molybdenum cofactor cytidylyltransferase